MLSSSRQDEEGGSMKVFIDLFSGLGGASAAFDLAPDWVVIKYDNNPELVEHNRGLEILDLNDVPTAIHSIRLRVSELMEAKMTGLQKLVIWASPPCNEFSYANATRPDEPSLDLVNAAREIIEYFDPDFWLVENVQGARPYFNEIFGRPPTQEIGPVILWGHFPLIPIRTRDEWKHRKMESKGTRLLRPNMRAIIPLPISEGLLDTIAHQQTLFDY